jgi:hypothetical protein
LKIKLEKNGTFRVPIDIYINREIIILYFNNRTRKFIEFVKARLASRKNEYNKWQSVLDYRIQVG